MPSPQQTLTIDQLRSELTHQVFPEHMSDGQVGLELEIQCFRETPENPAAQVTLFDDQGTGLVQTIKKFEGSIKGLKWAPKGPGFPRFEISDGGQLTFEPGGQLEYSGPPKENLAVAIADFVTIIEQLRCHLKSENIWLFHSGLNPWYSLDQIPLQLTAPRYQNMNKYLASVGPYGQRMMRQSTSLQVNLDCGPKEVALRRYLASNLMAPIFTALFGNSPFVDGKATGSYSFRSKIWQNLDKTRTGIPKNLLTPEYSPCIVEQYLNFALDANLLTLPNGKGESDFHGTYKTFRQWMQQPYNGLFPSKADWDNHLTTIFPEVRVRGFLEIRYLDAQSKVWCSVPGILLTHLLYNQEATEAIISKLGSYRTTLPGMLEVAADKGMDEPEIANLSREIYQLALKTAQAHDEDPKVLELCERFYQRYTHNNRNPAAELVRLNDGNIFTPQQYRDFEKCQVNSAGDLIDIICEYC